ncbi:MAG: response regulator [Anaerolineae bacterium]|nr:response regulator [Anaerolineae bacterium]
MPEQNPLVLVADDERNAVILLTRILERDGFVVESARDGVTALEKIRALHPDLILMDVQMPRMNGFEVTEQLRADASTRRIPVIFVTAAAREPTDVAHGFEIGAVDYVRKPYNYHELLARVHSKIRARQLEERLERRSEELEALVRIGGELNQRLGLQELTELIVLIAQQELNASHAALYLFDEDQKPVLYLDTAPGNRSVEEAAAMLRQRDSVVSQTFHSSAPVLLAGNDNGSSPPPHLREQGLHSAAGAPLKHHGRLLGVLTVAHTDTGYFNENSLRMLRSIGEQAALAVRNAQLHAALQSYAQNLEQMVNERTQQLQEAQAQLIQTEKLAALGRMAAGIAHEVNNPLQPILGCLEVAIEEIETGQEVDVEGLHLAEGEVQRIKTIVSRLLDFARPVPSSMLEIVDFRALIQEVINLASKQLERGGVTIQAALQPIQPITGNATQLKQVALNLMLNALEAMPDGGTVSVEMIAEEKGVSLIVADTGIGMDSQTLERIFEPFYTTKGEGVGLGLSVSYGIVQGHGGDLRVESEPGQGSKFTLWLPYNHPGS